MDRVKLLLELQEAIRKEKYSTQQIEDLREERRLKIEEFKEEIKKIRRNLDSIEAEFYLA